MRRSRQAWVMARVTAWLRKERLLRRKGQQLRESRQAASTMLLFNRWRALTRELQGEKGVAAKQGLALHSRNVLRAAFGRWQALWNEKRRDRSLLVVAVHHVNRSRLSAAWSRWQRAFAGQRQRQDELARYGHEIMSLPHPLSSPPCADSNTLWTSASWPRGLRVGWRPVSSAKSPEATTAEPLGSGRTRAGPGCGGAGGGSFSIGGM